MKYKRFLNCKTFDPTQLFEPAFKIFKPAKVNGIKINYINHKKGYACE